MTKTRALFLALVAALVCAFVAPVDAQTTDPRAQRDELRRKRAALAQELDTVKASEAQLLQAAAALDDQVSAQQARVAAARQALEAAEREVAEATAALEQTRTALEQLHTAFVNRAVRAYMTPNTDAVTEIAPAGDLAEGARRTVLLQSVAASDEALLDELAATREDYELQQEAARAAQERASARRAESEQRLVTLEANRAEAERLRAAVSARRQEVLTEIAAQDAADEALRKVIAESEARAARAAAAEAARQAQARRTTSTGGGGGTSTGGSTSDGGSGGSNPGGCIWPTRGTVTSEYGNRWGRLHAGIDISAPTGTAIWAAKAGVVSFAGAQSGYGNTVIINHGGGMTTVYAHQSQIMVGSGQSVSQGQRIGSVGNTGRSTGPHLHFETRYNGSPQNPRRCLP
jgi:murein DD-endopeptidase MepM/ murein hydrolase activator NlpD